MKRHQVQEVRPSAMRTRARGGLRFWGMGQEAAHGLVRRPERRRLRPAAQAETLEGRTLLTAVLIDASNNLSITGSGGNNNLTVSVANGIYTFADPSEVFNVTNNGTATVSGNGLNTLTVSGIISIEVDTAGGNDTVNLRSS